MKSACLGVALLLATMPLAFAQHQPTTPGSNPPNSINRAARGVPHYQSGAENQATASGKQARVVGRGRYCTKGMNRTLNCRYRTMASCRKSGHHGNLSCVANPALATGSAVRR